ncbi:MAG: Mth938-like domain-containing protein [Planctomycetota bacterium]|nr:Mth938-like domain-containing protein [Planctomycetota bacterium]
MTMNDRKPSPRIIASSWGKLEVEGLGIGKDFKLYPGGGRPWDWRETGTQHSPGIQPADIQELIDQGCVVIVLTRGRQLALQVCPETIKLLEEKRIRYHSAETGAAIELYSQLAAKGEALGGLFHSTC